MQMVKKILLPLIVGYLALLLFMPKTELYYMLEEELSKHDITLNENSIEEGLFSLSVKGITLYAKGVKVATIESLDYFTLLLYNHVELNMLEVDEILKSTVPEKTTKLELSQHIFSPLSLSVEGNGSFGVLEGKIDLSTRMVRLDFTEEKEIDMLMPLLKKDEKGRYYEKSF